MAESRRKVRRTGRNKKVFSLAAANAALPLVAEFTEEAVSQLDSLRKNYQLDLSHNQISIPEHALLEVEHILLRWSARIAALGAYPKGYFTVDFQSVDPQMLYCWTMGEETITHTHRVWENFSHRRPLVESSDRTQEHMKWVN